jgi:hypothetical protein
MKRYPKKLRWFWELWRSLIQDKRNVSSNFWILLSIKVSLCEWLQSFGQSEVKIIKWPFYKVLQSNDKRFVQSLLWNQTIRDLFNHLMFARLSDTKKNFEDKLSLSFVLIFKTLVIKICISEPIIDSILKFCKASKSRMLH